VEVAAVLETANLNGGTGDTPQNGRRTNAGLPSANDSTVLPGAKSKDLPAVLSVAPTVLDLLNCLRRRWLVALTLGLLLVPIVGAAVWFAMPPARFLARSLLHVDSRPPSIAFPNVEPRGEFSSYQRTQLALVKSRLVLGNVLTNPKVAGLSVVREAIRDQLDPIDWLETELKVDYSVGPEILRISLSGDRPNELAIIVDTVREAYMQKIVNKERAERMGTLTQLEETYTEYQENLRKKEQELRKLAKAVGSSDLPTVAIKQQLAAERLGIAQRELRQYQADIRTLRYRSEDLKTREEGLATWQAPDTAIEAQLQKSPVVVPLLEEIAQHERDFARAKQVADDMVLRRYRLKIDAARAKLDTARAEVRPMVVRELRDEYGRRLQAGILDTKERLEAVTKIEATLRDEVKQLEQETSSLNVGSLDVELLRREVARSEAIVKNLGDQKEALKVELKARPRVQVLEEAVISPTHNEKKRIVVTLGAALGTLVFICWATAFHEARLRRVSKPEDVSRGLGIKLIGTVPDIHRAIRKARNADESAEAAKHLAEALAAIRAMLLYSENGSPAKVAMVSSAAGGEGKTSLALQLAASLARSGRRTLLVDADLRKPDLHHLLKTPASPGLCEVLEGKAGLADGIYTTSLDTLWAMPAGSSTTAPLDKTAGSELADLFRQLRSGFDFVVVDAPPIMPVADALALGQHVDGVIFAVLRGVSQLPSLYAASQRLAHVGVRVFGAVVSGMPLSGPRSTYPGRQKKDHALSVPAVSE
jgi:capsular exopolysaccharide synthesis family protein